MPDFTYQSSSYRHSTSSLQASSCTHSLSELQLKEKTTKLISCSDWTALRVDSKISIQLCPILDSTQNDTRAIGIRAEL